MTQLEQPGSERSSASAENLGKTAVTEPGRAGESALPAHYRRPQEAPLRAEERGRTTILFGGLTWRHEKLTQAVFLASGYRFECLPNPDLSAFRTGKEYCNVGHCNPVYFTVGSLIQFLRSRQEQGLSRQEIIDRYAFYTAGSCGPCRFGMYEAEYRFALKNAGFDGFRVLLFQQQAGFEQDEGVGLEYSFDFGMGVLKALNLADSISDLIFHLRPYEVQAGQTEEVARRCVDELSAFLRHPEVFEILEAAPPRLAAFLRGKKGLNRVINGLVKFRKHFYGRPYLDALEGCRRRFDQIEVDRLRVKPVIKITGEFWGQLTESDGNYNMFDFLEKEGAQVLVDPMAEWLRYLLYQAKANVIARRGVDVPHPNARPWQFFKRLANQLPFWKKKWLFSFAERAFTRQFNRTARALGGLDHELAPQSELARLAHPFYNSLARGGEGHLEVGKNIYYTVNRRCHMVLSLKPFGCMPSTQSDGVQTAVMERFPEMLFLPVETSGDGEIHAQSRVLMALREAKIAARREFQQVLQSTGKELDEIRHYCDRVPQLRKPFYPLPHRPGIAGLAAQFVLHVSDLMDGKATPAVARKES